MMIHLKLPFSTRLTRIFHQHLGNLKASVPSITPRNFLGNVYEHSLQKFLGISKKHIAQYSHIRQLGVE